MGGQGVSLGLGLGFITTDYTGYATSRQGDDCRGFKVTFIS